MLDTERTSFRSIRDELTRRIARREWAPGELIPGEETLAVEFGAARATVNRALQDLARSGLVERKRKAGTRVARNPLREARFLIPLIRDEIEARGATYRYVLLSKAADMASDIVRARMGLAAKAETLHLRCLHLADGLPFQFEDRWINLEAVPAARQESFETTGPNEWLVNNAPFSEAEFGMFAAAASIEDAELLQVRPGDPVFVTERVTRLMEKPVTLVRMVHPQSHRVTIRF